jgi:hypothetical protein
MIILKEYNLKLIDINLLFQNISIKIYSFINCNNLKLNIKNIDCKRIFTHFLIEEFIQYIDNNYKNVFYFANNINYTILSELFDNNDILELLQNSLIDIEKYCNFFIFFGNTILQENISENEILKIQLFLQKKTKRLNPLKKMKMFCKKNGLEYILENLKSVECSYKFA